MRWQIFLGVAAILAAGCSSTSGPERTGAPAQNEPPTVLAFSPGLKVVADNPALLDGESARQLDLMTLRDLVMRFQLPGMPGDLTWIELKLFNPNGVRVQDRRLAFSTSPTMIAAPADKAAHPFPVSQATVIPGGFALDFSIPVGGTNMQRRPVGGVWKITVDVDGRPELHAEQSVLLMVAQ